LRYFFVPIFPNLNVKGIKFRLKGKISVAGNARTRTILQRTGITGHATFNNKILSDMGLVRTFTGVIGLKV
jgi:ribosomal protein S3